jgi:hypothetical protein
LSLRADFRQTAPVMSAMSSPLPRSSPRHNPATTRHTNDLRKHCGARKTPQGFRQYRGPRQTVKAKLASIRRSLSMGTAMAVAAALCLGFLAGLLAFKQKSRWCTVCGATFACPESHCGQDQE